MNFTELCAEVYTLTRRSDRVAETVSAVKAATLKAHQSDYYYKDIFEVGVDFGAPNYVQNLDYRAALPRYRSTVYLRKYDATTSTPGLKLDIIIPEQIFDRYQSQKSDIAYIAGAYIQINSSTSEQYYLFGCYLNPDISQITFDSWIALDHPYCIIFDAAATVFKAIGKDEEASAYRGMVAEQIAMVRISNIQSIGY